MRSWMMTFLGLSTMLAAQGGKPPGDQMPVLPNASLLVGVPPDFLVISNQHGNLKLQPEDHQPESRSGNHIYASISKNGQVVAYARLKVGMPERVVTISTYSVKTHEHVDYAEGEFSGSVAISPDASKLVYSASRRREHARGDDHMHIINLRTGEHILGPTVGLSWPVFASWSPDAQRIAYGVRGEIYVWDLASNKTAKIADGDLPVWSPSGEWIAYLQGYWVGDKKSRQQIFMPGRWSPQCFVVHPDGSGHRMLIDLSAKNQTRTIVAPPVWSPDSTSTLLNELVDVDKGTVDIHLVELKTQTLKTLFKDTLCVLGWAEEG